MNKIKIVIEREFKTGVLNRKFWIMTLLVPIAGILFYGVMVWLAFGIDSDIKKIAVVDPMHFFDQKEWSSGSMMFQLHQSTTEELKQKFLEKKIYGFLILPTHYDPKLTKDYTVAYYLDEKVSDTEIHTLKTMIKDKVSNHNLQILGIKQKDIDFINPKIEINYQGITKNSNEVGANSVGMILVVVIAMIFMMMIAIYGTRIMQSVIEEKRSRVIEVLITSINPFELLTGKILGTLSVIATQIAVWVLFSIFMGTIGLSLYGGIMTNDTITIANSPEMQNIGNDFIQNIIEQLLELNWITILFFSMLFLLIGLLIYSCLYAMVGSMVGEDIKDANTLAMPFMMILMTSFYIAMGAMKVHDSNVVVWSSMIPLISCLVMPARLIFDPPLWQIIVALFGNILFGYFIIRFATIVYKNSILEYTGTIKLKEILSRYKMG